MDLVFLVRHSSRLITTRETDSNSLEIQFPFHFVTDALRRLQAPTHRSRDRADLAGHHRLDSAAGHVWLIVGRH